MAKKKKKLVMINDKTWIELKPGQTAKEVKKKWDKILGVNQTLENVAPVKDYSAVKSEIYRKKKKKKNDNPFI